MEGPLEDVCFNSQRLLGGGKEGEQRQKDILPSSKQALLKLLGASVIQNTCFVGGIHQAVGGVQPEHGERHTSSSKKDLKIMSRACSGTSETSFQADLQNPECQWVSRKYKVHFRS